MTEVEIEYCVPCGLLEHAQQAQRTLLDEFGSELEAVSLVPGTGGVFEIRIEDEVVFDGQEQVFEAASLLSTVRERLPGEAPA